MGVDLGDRVSHYSVLDAAGKELERGAIETRWADFESFFRSRSSCRVVIETSTHSPWVNHLLLELGHEVLVANPRRVRLISENPNKHDRIDPLLLARLGRFDPQLLSPIRHRSLEAHADLARVRSRHLLVRQRTSLANHIRSVVKSMGGRIPSDIGPAALPRKAGAYVPEELRECLEPLFQTLAFVQSRIRELEKRIERLCRRKYPETERLRQVAGVGPITSLTFVLTIEDPDRFDRCRDVGPYLGLVPRRDASGQRDPELPITKAGDKHLRWLLVQCSQRILGRYGKDSDLRRWGLALADRGKKNAKKRAVTALARKLGVLLLSLWRSGEEYEPLRNTERSARNAA